MLTADYLPNVGGIASHIVELSTALSVAGHQVEIWYWRPYEHATTPEVSSGIPVRTIHAASKLGIKRARTIVDAFPIARELLNASDEFLPDVIHVHTLGPLPTALSLVRLRRRHITTALTNHSSGYLKLVATRRGRLMARGAWSGHDLVLAPSMELLRASKHLLAHRKAYVPNGVWSDSFPGTQSQSRKALGLSSDTEIIMTTRRFAQKNGLRYAVEAMIEIVEHHPNVHLVMIGGPADSVEWPTVDKIIESNGLDEFVTRVGSVENQQAQRLLQAADIVCVPSLMEATSISALEAMASGKAIVATDVGGLPELIHHGKNGLLVKPRSPQDLAKAMLQLLDDKELRHQLGDAARQRAVAEFDWTQVAHATLREYQTAVGRRTHSFHA